GGSTAGALFSVVSVVNRNLKDQLDLPVGNIIYSNPGSSSPDDAGITTAQSKVAGFGTADSWFDLITSVSNGSKGAFVVLAQTADNSFTKKVDSTFFGAFSFSISGTIDQSGNLNISLYSGVAGSDFNDPPTTTSITKLADLHVTSTGITVPEP